MGKNSNIAWTDNTANGWIGCTEVGDDCLNCYARVLSNRMGWAEWGPGKPRHRTKNWKGPLQWDRKAREAGVMTKTFAFSLVDFFDAEVPEEWRLDYIDQVIRPTTNTWWLLATKRPSIARRYRDILPWEKI